MNIKLLNKIAKIGTDIFDRSTYTVGEEVAAPQAIMVRSAAMHDMTFNPELLAIARAGAGVNNIPLDKCAEEGIVVFNTPGANANGVCELAVAALLLASRGIVDGIKWTQTLAGNADAAKLVEKEKSKFAGTEIKGKTLGIIGLGAIGGLLANAALSLGMKVIGCDFYLSVDAAWKLSPNVKKAASYDEVYEQCDYLSVHVPATPETKGFINASSIAKMKDGVKIINLARADLVNAADLKAAIASGKVSAYVTDFPTPETIGEAGIITIPHLGASTEEAEDNCAVMAANQLVDYLENGNIVNSVNYPNVSAPRAAKTRVCVLSKNASADKIAALIPAAAVTSRTKGDFTYAIYDTDAAVDKAAIEKTAGVIRCIVHNA